MPKAMSYSTGKFVTGQQEVVFTPRTRTRQYLVVITHGYGGSVAGAMNILSFPGYQAVLKGLTDNGAVVVAHDLHLNSFGNDASLADIEAIRLAAGTYGCSTNKIVLFGGSMGGTVIWNYLRAYSAQCAGACMAAPLTDLNGYYANPDSTLGLPDIPIAQQQGDIATAWGVVAPAALPARADPLTNAATIAAGGVPVWVGYADSSTNGLGDADDNGNPVVLTQSLTDMKNVLGNQMTLVNISHTAIHGDQETVASLPYGVVDQMLVWAS